MPRNGSGVLSAPAGTLGTPNTVIESAKYNAFVNDWVADGNAARPITAGGTAGVTAVAGADNLSTKGTDIPSATTTDIGAATGRYVHITGTTTITGLGTKTAGVLRIVTFDGALTLTHNATSLILPSGANILTAAGDVASFVSEGGGNWRCVGYTRASGSALSVSGGYLAKSGNYTALDADFGTDIYFSALATLSIDVTANLRTNWHTTIWADGGAVTIDPNSTDTVNGSTTLVIQQGQKAFLYKTGATTFRATLFGDPLSGPQLQGYFTGLTLTTNVSDATNDVDIAVGAAASDVSPYYLMQLTSALTKRIDANWVVGTNQGGLDTGSVANSTYYIWLIQRSDTLVTDVLFSLSSTVPTMPTSYDRKRLIGSLVRTAGVNSVPASLLIPGNIRSGSVLTLAGTSSDIIGIPAGVKRVTIPFANVSTNGTTGFSLQLGTSAGIETTGYKCGTSSGNSTTEFPLTGTSSGATGDYQGIITLELLNPATNLWAATSVVGRSDTSVGLIMGGSKPLAGTLDRIRFKTGNGVEIFDAGSGNVNYQ